MATLVLHWSPGTASQIFGKLRCSDGIFPRAWPKRSNQSQANGLLRTRVKTTRQGRVQASAYYTRSPAIKAVYCPRACLTHACQSLEPGAQEHHRVQPGVTGRPNGFRPADLGVLRELSGGSQDRHPICWRDLEDLDFSVLLLSFKTCPRRVDG